ncbi:L-threonylcarbamoyladenylate synthase [Nocardiopsis sp. NPDC050513]|uniref:L-threonylcarbamoyladenylate synthase n=1 Tax=Nocardiopsis sp. NPDC050513 TaxID=3364338 RepID=UPI0037B68BFD
MRWTDHDRLSDAEAAIASGHLVIVPTNRWYMICADAGDEDACQRIFDAKRRPADKPLALIAPSSEVCERLFVLTAEARALADQFWPGDLAMLMRWREAEDARRYSSVGAPALVTRDPGTLGELARRSGTLVAATTVNISGQAGDGTPGPAVSPCEVDEFLELTGTEVHVAIDGGVCPEANHLTIVDCSSNRARIARPGLVHARAIAATLGREVNVM